MIHLPVLFRVSLLPHRQLFEYLNASEVTPRRIWLDGTISNHTEIQQTKKSVLNSWDISYGYSNFMLYWYHLFVKLLFYVNICDMGANISFYIGIICLWDFLYYGNTNFMTKIFSCCSEWLCDTFQKISIWWYMKEHCSTCFRLCHQVIRAITLTVYDWPILVFHGSKFLHFSWHFSCNW